MSNSSKRVHRDYLTGIHISFEADVDEKPWYVAYYVDYFSYDICEFKTLEEALDSIRPKLEKEKYLTIKRNYK